MILSIIVPVYNVESYIEDCLQSILNQNILPTNYEIICVNDGSTDASLKILLKFAEKHSNLHIINQANRGSSAARNIGLEHSHGDYIWFIDSDDFIVPNCLNEILNYLAVSKESILQISFKMVKEDFNYNQLKSMLDNKIALKLYKSKCEYCPNVFSYIWKKELITYRRFNENLKYAEDYSFVLPILIQKDYICKCENIIYYYRIRQNSISTNNTVESRIKKLLSSIAFYNEILEIKKDNLNEKQIGDLNIIMWDTKADIMVRMLKLDFNDNRTIDLYNRIITENIHPYEFKPNKLFQKWCKNKTIKENLYSYLITLLKIVSFSKITFFTLNYIFKQKNKHICF